RNCRFDGVNKNNRQGISIYYSDGFTIDRCSFRNITRDDMPGAIDIEPDRGMNVVRNGVISNCTFFNIGGMGAIAVVQQPETSGKIVSISNCDFQKVNAPLAVIGSQNYLNTSQNVYTVSLMNSTVTDSKEVADFRFAKNVYIANTNFTDITTETYNNVSAVGVNNIRFENCIFNKVYHVDGLTFTGPSKKIDFVSCRFLNFKKQAITINDPGGIGQISDNFFESTGTPKSFPLLTGIIRNRRMINQNLLLNNRSSGNFLPFSVLPFFID
ncbi:MAG: hypothetical protein KJ689_07570, partial [Bacteroidetes bacterium]|nr:hypothetical protein [Bacteroidota bacterium]